MPGIAAPSAGLRGSTVNVEWVTSLAGIAGLHADYDHLTRVTGNTLPFALHEWHLTWCRHFLNRNPRIIDEPAFFVLRKEAGECAAIIPFVTSRRRFGPVRIVSVNLLGADPAITEIRAPLIEPGFEHLTARAVQAHFALKHDWDWIHWTGVGEEFAAALDAGGGMQWQPSLPVFVLDLPPTWEDFHAGLKRNIRESLRHCYNSLKRDNHRFELQVIEAPGDISAGVDCFLKLHVMRAKHDATVIHPNRFAGHVSRDFLYAICERLAECGAVRLFQLKIGVEVVAMRIGFVVGDGLYLYYSGFNPAWGHHSVMTTTVAESIKYAIALGLKTVNLSSNKDLSKTRWGPRQIEYRAAYVQGGRLRSRVVRRAYMKARSGAGLQAWVLQHVFHARRSWD